MDYKEKYNKLKADIEKAYLFAQTDSTKSVLEHILPELKESRDEKIKGAIIHFISHTPSVPKGVIGKETMLDWLEKQKVTDEEIIFRPVVGTDIRIAAKQALEKIDIGKKVVLAFNGAYIPVNGKTVGEIDSEYDAWLKKCIDDLTQQEAMDIAVAKCFEQGGQKPIWGDKDDSMFQSCIGAVATNDYYKGEEKEQIYDWLKSIKQRIGG